MLRFTIILICSSLLLGCGKHRAFVAVQDGRIALNVNEAAVVAAVGKPDLILARKGVETLYYRHRKRAVSVSVLNGRVVAFDDADSWPNAAFETAKDADHPVSLGQVRVGVTEKELRARLGDPDGITAKDRRESLHWLGGDNVDSVVEIKDGKVIGYWDRPVSEYTQNLPTSGNRDKATTGGQIRVGMTTIEVEKLLGKPDGKKGAKGLITHRYESDPIFGDTILYSVGYKDDKVVNLHEFNLARDEEKKEKEKAQRRAARAEKRAEEAESSIFSFLNNPLVKNALGSALATGKGRRKTVRRSTKRSKASRSLNINGRSFSGGAALGQPCGGTRGGCPSGYSCHVVVGNSGTCVQ